MQMNLRLFKISKKDNIKFRSELEARKLILVN